MMDTRTRIFLFLAIFYTVLFGLLGIVPTTISEDNLVEQDFILPDSFLISSCESFIMDAWTYYECDGYEFSSQQVLDINATHIIIDTAGENQGFFRWILERSEWGTSVIGFFDNINNRITGLHPIFQTILWSPLSILLVWLMILLVVWIIPFVGGGA